MEEYVIKTEELNALKNEVETLNNKLAELTEEELAEVIGSSSGMDIAERVIRGDYDNDQERVVTDAV